MRFAGGTSIDTKKYLKLTAGPLRNKRVHILVAEAMLGRDLLPGEEVNHLDGDKLNPDWRNLKVTGKSEHGAISNRQRWFLKNRAAEERSQWADWINNGGARPDLVEADTTFNPEELEQENHATGY